MNKKDHLRYIKEHGNYIVDCNRNIFSESELELLKKYGHWYKALQETTLLPLNEKHKHFIEVANFKTEPISEHEKAWWKYLKRKEIETNCKDSLNKQYYANQDQFYNRDMHKQLRKQMYGVMNKNHRQ